MAVNSGLPTKTPTIPALPPGATYATGADGQVYVKYATQNASGQWVQTVSKVTNGVLIPLLQALFPNGILPNNAAATTLPNGQILTGFETVGGGDTGGGTSNNSNTILLVAGGAIAAFLIGNKLKTN